MSTSEAPTGDWLGTYLDNGRIGKDLVEHLELVAPRSQRIDNPVLFSGADLHQAHQASIRPEVVMLQVDSNLLGLLQLFQHIQDTFVSVYPGGGCFIDRLRGNGLGGLEQSIWVCHVRDFRLVRMFVSTFGSRLAKVLIPLTGNGERRAYCGEPFSPLNVTKL